MTTWVPSQAEVDAAWQAYLDACRIHERALRAAAEYQAVYEQALDYHRWLKQLRDGLGAA
jgi:hypothetical protein